MPKSDTLRFPARTDRPARPSLSVVFPVLNESRNLPHVLPRLPEDCELVLVDGHSLDETIAVAHDLRPDLTLVVQNRTGKGNALVCGFSACRGDVILMMDADGSMAPEEIASFEAALLAGADLVKGVPFHRGRRIGRHHAPRRAGNRVLNGIVNVIYHQRFTDLCYGYMAFWRDVLPCFELTVGNAEDGYQWGDGFEIEAFLNARAAMCGLTIVEIPSSAPRGYTG